MIQTLRVLAVFLFLAVGSSAADAPQNPILFVTQVPVPADFTTIGSVFGNHIPTPGCVARGGDLWIRYPDGTSKNLTAAAGFGTSGQQQDENSIAVREPSVHWSGTKTLFSMVIGSPDHQFDYEYEGYWQIYEITGLGQNETPVITKVPNQPVNFNNVSPIYGTDERIIFTSDRPHNGARHLYPQRDEYELAPTISGIFSLNPADGNLFLMSHDPSGSFSPTIDSFGRVIFTRWDHLQRDQEADADAEEFQQNGGTVYGTMNFSDESAGAAQLPRQEELFPEPRAARQDLLEGTNLQGHSFNQFFPWMINEDGTEEETINHIGRHELFNYFGRSLTDDSNVRDFFPSGSRVNQNRLEAMLQIKEDPTHPGHYIGIDAPEFSTHASGQIVRLVGPPSLNPDQMYVEYITDRATQSYNGDGEQPDPKHSGLYRNPLPLSNGVLLAVHTAETRADKNKGTAAAPESRYDFRIKTIIVSPSASVAGAPLMSSFTKTVSWWSPDILVTYSGPLWELDPVEVIARPKPNRIVPHVPAVEQSVFDEEQVDLLALRAYMEQNNLALVVSRNVTTRDKADKQQPYNLRITGTTTETSPSSGTKYDISYMQFFQGDQLRGFTGGGGGEVRPGRRVLATPMHDATQNEPAPNGPSGSVKLGDDGSMAAFVPARRAMTWQATAENGTPVVRERYWLSFQPGEIRTCTSCHGVNTSDQANQAGPQNKPEALRSLMQHWKNMVSQNPNPSITSGPTANPNPVQAGQSVAFSVAAIGTGALTYTWNFGDGSPTTTGANVNHSFSAPGSYNASVTVADGGGKSATDSVTVTVTAGNTPPVIATGPFATPNPAQVGKSVTFSATATGSGSLAYSWNFGDGSAAANGATVVHAYASANVYTATLTVTDSNSLTTSATLTVTVNSAAPQSLPLTVTKAKLTFDFRKAAHDSFQMSGTVELPGNFATAQKNATVTLGSAVPVIAPINGKSKTAAVKLKSRAKKSTNPSAPVAWTVTANLKSQTVFSALQSLGFTNNQKEPIVLNLPVELTVDSFIFAAEVPLTYKAAAGKSGSGMKK